MAKKRTRSQMRLIRKQRVSKKVFGTTLRPRLSIFRSLSDIYAQVIDDEGGQTLVSASTVDAKLRKQMDGLNKTQQATLVGKQVAERAREKGVSQVVFDRGGYRYIGRVKALADGAREGGLDF